MHFGVRWLFLVESSFICFHLESAVCFRSKTKSVSSSRKCWTSLLCQIFQSKTLINKTLACHQVFWFFFSLLLFPVSSFHSGPRPFSSVQFSSVQSLSRVQLFATPWITARQASLSIINSQSLPKLMSHQVSEAIQPSYPLSSPSPPALNPSQHQGLFQWVNSSHEVARVLEFQL